MIGERNRAMRLIDADRLLKGKDDHEMISTHIIWNSPTVDAEPVRHGFWDVYKWRGDKEEPNTEMTCSVCGITFFSPNDLNANEFHYCPNCGRKMDEEVDDD